MDASLLRAVLDAPEEDAPRFACAAWLEAHGDRARAELIRVQLALAGMVPDDPDGAALRARQGALLRAHLEAWHEALPELSEALAWEDPRRGFVEGVSAVPTEELPRRAAELLAAIPLRRLTLVCDGAIHPLRGSELLRHARELVLLRNSFTRPSPPVDDPLLAEVLSWPELSGLRALELREPEFSAVAAARLAEATLPALTALAWRRPPGGAAYSLAPILEAPWFPGLARLELDQHPLSGTLLARLCARLDGARLRRLALRGAALVDADAEVLASSGLAGGIELCDVRNNALGPTGVLALVGALPPRARLLLDGNPLGDEGLATLAGAALLARLSELPRCRAGIGDRGLEAVARSPHATRVTSIYLPHNQVTAAGLAALLASPHLPALRLLNLTGNAVAALPAVQHPSLEVLCLGRNPFGGDALSAFGAEARLPSLKTLVLDNCGLGPEAMTALASAQGLPSLASLDVSSNPLGDPGAAALLSRSGLPGLRELNLRDCGLSDRTALQWTPSQGLSRLARVSLLSSKNPLGAGAYQALRQAAWAQGCDVDHWSLVPTLRPVQYPPTPGAALAPEERRALSQWINLLSYAEYHRVGWLKAASVEDLRDRAASPRERRALARYERSEGVDDALRREVLALFLRRWMVSQIPESVGVYGVDAAAFLRVERAQALALVDQIVAASERDPRGMIHGRAPPYGSGPGAPATSTGRAERLPYRWLRRWFADELLDPSEAVYFVHDGPGGPTVRYNREGPRVVGMDRTVLAIMWLE